MGIKSASKSKTVNQSNGNYEVDGIIFASKFVFKTIKSIDRNLRFLYTTIFDEFDCETINHSLVRVDEEEFDAILGRVEERIGRITDFHRSTHQFLYKEKRGDFFEKFRGVLDCINEGVHLNGEFKNNFERRIGDIVKSLCYIGINPY